MAFWPMGPLFRGDGAYSFGQVEGNPVLQVGLPQVPRVVISEGYSRSSSAELGGPQQTGKIMTRSRHAVGDRERVRRRGRRDLYPYRFHPFGPSSRRTAYKKELPAGQKEKESFGACCVLRRVLRQKYGTVYVTFSGADLAERGARARVRSGFRRRRGGSGGRSEYFVQKLGFRLCAR